MLRNDPETQAALDDWTFPGRSVGLTRRRFLQLSAMAGAGAAMASPLLSHLEAYAAPPLGSHDPILVLVMLAGGNDGLNMVVPIQDSNYLQLRPTIGLTSSQTLNISPSVGLHPSFTNLKARYDNGQVAIIRGVGYNPPDFSHFTSMGYWMNAWGGSAQTAPNGWVGRYIDNFPNAATESLYSVVLGSNGVPLHMVGAQSRAAALPLSVSGKFGISRSNQDDQRMYDGVSSFASTASSGLGKWGDMVADGNANLMRLTRRLATAYPAQAAPDYFVRQMQLVANLVNKNLGTRVFSVELDGFDTHTDELVQHSSLFTSLDNGIEMLFSTLNPTWADNVIVVTFSEFGRRPQEDVDAGTDHGTSAPHFVVGPRVRGGLYGQQPGLANNQLVNYGNLAAPVDFRSVFATVLQKWMKADDAEVLGKTYPQLGFIGSTP